MAPAAQFLDRILLSAGQLPVGPCVGYVDASMEASHDRAHSSAAAPSSHPKTQILMNAHRSLLLAASLGFASCASAPAEIGAPSAAVQADTLTVHVVEASGGA